MKKPNMFRVLVTTASMAALALAAWPAQGQPATVKPPEAGEKAAAPNFNLKVEQNQVWVRPPSPDQHWESLGPATVGNAVKALRDLYPDKTFAVDPRVAVVPVADLILIIRDDDPTTDLAALRTSCGGRFGFHEENALYTVEYNNLTDVDPSTREDRRIECFNLTRYLQREKALAKGDANNNKGAAAGGVADMTGGKQAEAAVARLQDIIGQSISDFDPSISPPHFRFYADAQMLILIGSHRAIDIAAKVIYALPGQPTFTRNPFGVGDSGDTRGEFQEMKEPGAAMKSDMFGTPPLPDAPPVPSPLPAAPPVPEVPSITPSP